MLNRPLKSIVSSGSAAVLVAALGTHAFGAPEESRGCRDLRADITAIRLALGVVDGKVDQSNQSSAEVKLALGVLDGKVDQSRLALGVLDGKVDQITQSSAAIRLALGVLDGKVDQSNQSSAAIRLALGVLDGKVDQSNADLAIVRGELQRIREALLARAPVDEGLELQVTVDQMSCASGAVQCEFAIPPSLLNQIPVEIKILVLRNQVPVTNLEIADFTMTGAFSPGRGPVTVCADGETDCGSPEFFVSSGNGCYQMWVHPPTDKWVSGTYSLLLRATDTEGRSGTKLVIFSVAAGTGTPLIPPPVTQPPGRGIDPGQPSVDAAN